MHRATLAAHPDELSRGRASCSANGAFVLKEWVQGSHILALRNAKYWNDAATHLDGVKYLQIPDENAELTRYRAGELQVTFVVPRSQFDWIKANLAGELHVAPQLDHLLLRLQPATRAVQGPARAAARAVARHRP